MEDVERRVCCMCGDVGFFDKLFHCTKCLNRFQHSYCSSYYKEQADPIKICDWCQCETRSSRSEAKQSGSSKRSYRSSEYSLSSSSSNRQIKEQEIKQISTSVSSVSTSNNSMSQATDKGKIGIPSPRTATRRYKLLKDVMC